MRRQENSLYWLIVCGCILLIGARVMAAPGGQIIDPFQELVFDTRADIELLAEQVFGGPNRPPGWTGNVSVESPSVVADLWVDNELLADQVFGTGVRPPDWFGATVINAPTLVRNVRHDLEATANAVYEVGVRPAEWRGSPTPYVVCSRITQNLLSMFSQFYNLQPETPESALNYCGTLEAEFEDDVLEIIFTAPDERGVQLVPADLIIGVRADLDRLTDQLLPTRPDGYIGERERGSETYYADILLDLETIANATIGAGVRPPGWAAAIPNNSGQAYLLLRRNLELLADATVGIGTRPGEWQGVSALDRCEVNVRGLVTLARINYQFTFDQIDVNAPDYCVQVYNLVNGFVENPPVLDVAEEDAEVRRFTAESDYAFSYLDVAATQYMGTMPPGISFRAVYRNYGESTMMFVTGQDFALYIDRRFTTMAETVFRSLPTFNGAEPVAFCEAYWCNGPGPTPTPTGSGPLLQVLFNTTPVAPPDTTQLQTQKQLIPWNYIRVTYVSDNAATRTAQVALELCAQPADATLTCEPANFVFDNSTGTNKPVISQFNGLSVFEFRYGYTQNLVIEAETRYATDIWISDPTIR